MFHFRFESINEDDDGPIMNMPANPFFSVTMALKRQLSNASNGSIDECGRSESFLRAKRNWKIALKGLAKREDPWAKFDWEDAPTENATRYRYNPLSKKWTEEKVKVKMEPKTFGKGAMRECFRM